MRSPITPPSSSAPTMPAAADTPLTAATTPAEMHPEVLRGLSRDERVPALGGRSLADLGAPSAVQVHPDYLQLDGQYARVLALTAYPRTVTAGWLARLVGVAPIEASSAVRGSVPIPVSSDSLADRPFSSLRTAGQATRRRQLVDDLSEPLLECLITGQIQRVDQADKLCAIEHQVGVVADHA